jgi:cytochrome c oxidase accessory protein FixG
MYVSERKIYPRSVSGWFAGWRWALVWFTQILFYSLLWLPWNGRQAVLFDIANRRFFIFDLVLHPQDFIYLTGLLLISAYALFLFTTVAGRLWCGYACPQTVYTEIFLWVERKFEGDRVARMRLDAAPWSVDKLLRKGGKQFAWLTIGLWTGFTFVGYFTPVKVLVAEAAQLAFGPWEWFWVLFYGFATYGNAGYLREQVCKYMCPYARFQSAMFDRDTLIIGYDSQRGEPRGARGRKAEPKQLGLGSCIDCTLCVQVCPTGIDIRKGLQYECIGCAACIDVCDSVMDKMNYPRGLIRYATQNGIDKHWDRGQMFKRVRRPRVLVYSAILLLLCLSLGLSLAWRKPFRVDVVRDRATLARLVEDGYVENIYRLQIMNGTEREQHFQVTALGIDGIRMSSPVDLTVASTESRWVSVAVRVPPGSTAATGPGAHAIEFRIDGRVADAVKGEATTVLEKSTFIIPR